VAGPEASLEGGFELDGRIPRNPTWTVGGFLRGTVGFVVDLPIVGKLADYHTTLFDTGREMARAANTPPRLEATNRSRDVHLGLPVTLGAGCDNLGDFLYTARDQEDGCAVGLTISSSEEGVLPRDYAFQSEGPRTLTVTATDSNGATAQLSFPINVVNAPPAAYGSIGTNTAQATVPLFFSLAAIDPNAGRLGCDAITVSGGPVQVVSSQDGDCRYQVTFDQQGPQTLTYGARDAQGAVSSPGIFQVLVGPPPAVPPPTWVIPPGLEVRRERDNRLIPNEGELDCFDRVTLSAQAIDPGGRPVTYLWEAVSGTGTVTLTPDPDGKVRSFGRGRTEFRVTASNGSSQTSPLSQFAYFLTGCPR
jgi:hypothetical protein